MSPGRASSALTSLSPLVPCSALRTQVATPAQPPPSILRPACSSDQVMNEAHHGFPGATLAAARYWSTCGPEFVPTSRTPRWLCATRSAAAPIELPPPPPGTAAAASATATAPGAAGTGAAAAAGRLRSRSWASASLVW